MTAYHDTNLDPSMRPETYESSKPVNAWAKNTNGVPSAWGQQKEKGTHTKKNRERKRKNSIFKEIFFFFLLDVGVMASGVDFLTELTSK